MWIWYGFGREQYLPYEVMATFVQIAFKCFCFRVLRCFSGFDMTGFDLEWKKTKKRAFAFVLCQLRLVGSHHQDFVVF